MTSSHVGLDGGDSVFGFMGENIVISSSLLELLVVEHKSIISGCTCIASHDNQVLAQVHFPLAYIRSTYGTAFSLCSTIGRHAQFGGSQ